MSKMIDMSGEVFGRLTVLSYVGNNGHNTIWLCLCECGKQTQVFRSSLTSEKTTSCGCLHREKFNSIKHGLSHTPEHVIWRGIKARCTNPKHVGYSNYGARGVKMSKEWSSSFVTFLKDMGPRPTPYHTVDRKDSDGNYERGNCAWATMIEQQNNRRNNHVVSYHGKQMSLASARRCAGNVVSASTARARILAGWDATRAVSEPTKKWSRR